MLGLAAVALLSAGCAGIPRSGGLFIDQPVPQAAAAAAPDIRVLPPPPQPGANPEQIVEGFLQAQSNDQDGYAIARLYLAPGARWDTRAGAVVYDPASMSVQAAGVQPGASAGTGPSQPRAAGSGTVTATRSGASGTAAMLRAATTPEPASTRRASPGMRSAPRAGSSTTVIAAAEELGTMDGDGRFRAGAAEVRDDYRLVQVDQQWRILRPPAGLRLTSSELVHTYRSVELYWPRRDGQVLVPETVFLPASRTALPSELVRALLDGPSGELAGAVRTAFPPGTELSGTATVLAGVAGVDLSLDPAQLSGRQQVLLLDQLVATLSQLPDVVTVRVSAQGQPLLVGAGSEDLSVDMASALLVDSGPAGRLSVQPTARALAVAVSRSGRLAELLPQGAGRSLLVVDGRDSGVSGAFSAVGWRDGSVLVGGAAGLLLVNGAAQRVIGAPAVTGLAVAPDGVRVALTIGGRLWEGALGPGPRLTGMRPLAPELAVSGSPQWAGPSEVVVRAASGTGPVQPWRVQDSGSAILPVPDQPPLTRAPDAIAAAPDVPLVLAAGGLLWREEGDGFVPDGRGYLPAYRP